MRSISVAPAPERTLAREQPPTLVQRTVRRVDEVLRKAVSPPFRAARQGAAHVGAQRRDEGAVLVGAPEVHALELLVDRGEQHRPRQLGEQQSRPGCEHAQPRPGAVLYVQGQTHPCAVVPRDIAALHAESVIGCCGGIPMAPLAVRNDPKIPRARGPCGKPTRRSLKLLTPLNAEPSEATSGPGRFQRSPSAGDHTVCTCRSACGQADLMPFENGAELRKDLYGGQC